MTFNSSVNKQRKEHNERGEEWLMGPSRRRRLLGICSGGGIAQDHKSRLLGITTHFFLLRVKYTDTQTANYS